MISASTPIWGGPILGQPIMEVEEEVRFPKGPTRIYVATLLTASVGGLGLLAFGAWRVQSSAPREFLFAFGGALVTAAVLGVSVDAWLKQRLVRDAFEATFGYLLPKVLRDELNWVYSLALVCSEFREDLELRIEGDAVIAKFRIERRFENQGNHALRGDEEGVYGAMSDLAIDEWHRDEGRSEILSMGFRRGNNETSSKFSVERGAFDVVGSFEDEIVLHPGESVLTWGEGQEVGAISGELVFFVRVPTVNPRVRVTLPDALNVSVSMATRPRATQETAIGTNTYSHEGVLLPYQAIRVRWWPRKDPV